MGSGDEVEVDYMAQRSKMEEWLSVPFKSSARKDLIERFEVKTFPSLIFVDEDGYVHERDGVLSIQTMMEHKHEKDKMNAARGKFTINVQDEFNDELICNDPTSETTQITMKNAL